MNGKCILIILICNLHMSNELKLGHKKCIVHSNKTTLNFNQLHPATVIIIDKCHFRMNKNNTISDDILRESLVSSEPLSK